MSNIVLIGMPTAGKSTVGVILAKILGKRFIDTDIVIQNTEGLRLEQIIESEGVEGFIKTEERVILGINAENTVIATGGSIVYGKKAMKHLASNATVIYLKVDYDELMRRLKDAKERGVALRHGESIEEMYEERTKLYEKYADITICEEGYSVEDTITAIRKAL